MAIAIYSCKRIDHLAWKNKGRTIPPKIRQAVFERDNWQCLVQWDDHCEGIATQIDHIIGFADGGTNDMSNLRASCRSCNMRRASVQGRLAQGLTVKHKRKLVNPGLAGSDEDQTPQVPMSPFLRQQLERKRQKGL
ncbi:HNH endonuclease [Mycolicibacterium fortuitum]|uniref:HNH endonuclease n=1 Tax=Mycolicibacterium fortuitum TaxID=1766 RepID=UPI00148F4581|nr:HNH endonuclease [Mycolicibacterium fortuitum]